MTRHHTLSLALAALFCAAPNTLAQDELPAAEPGAGARTWTHADGRKIQAGIESAGSDTVTLRLLNGKTGTVKLDQLSDDDRKHVATWLANNAPPEGFGKPDTTIEIITPKGQMKYNKPTFTVYPGKKIKLVLRNEDDMHHNLVVCKPAKDKGMSVAMEAWKLGADGFAKHWIPVHDSLLFASKMAEPHSTATLYFTAPSKTGKYPYVCTIPGHAQVMNGTMVVSREVNPLSELTFTLFKGGWDKLPDFNTLKPAGTDHVESGLFDIGVTKDKENFGIVFNGKIDVPADGDYTFTIGSDDGSRLYIDRKIVVNNDGIHAHTNKSGKVKLSKGIHDIEVQYFEKGGQESLYVGWKGPGMKREMKLSKSGSPGGGGGGPTGQLLVAEDEARIYRNFIQGAGPRAIGVGYPGGINLAYDANNMRIAMLWLGDFIDAARHWSGRGQGFQPPAGESVVNGAPGVPFAVLDSPDAKWPEEFLRKDNAQQPPVDRGYVFRGYRLGGEARIPSFRYTFAGLEIVDTPKPKGSADSADASIVRTLRLNGKASPNLYFRAAVADEIKPNGDREFLVGDDLVMSFWSASKPIVRESGGKKELLVPVTPEQPGAGFATIEQTISWQ